MPPANNFPHDAPATRAYMMNNILGGMRIPRVPPAMTAPQARRTWYFLLSIDGRAMSPMVTTAAPMMPTTAARRVLASTVADASPPGNGAVHF